MALVKGPFDLQWGSDTLAGIEALDVTYEVSSDDLETIQGNTYTIFGGHKVSAEATFLESDVASLAVVLPQYFVANAGTLSTGETVSDPAGAIDIVPGGVASPETHGLIITGAGSPGQVARIVNASTEISGFEIDKTIRKVKVKFSGEAGVDQATLQFFKEGAVSGVS